MIVNTSKIKRIIFIIFTFIFLIIMYVIKSYDEFLLPYTYFSLIITELIIIISLLYFFIFHSQQYITTKRNLRNILKNRSSNKFYNFLNNRISNESKGLSLSVTIVFSFLNFILFIGLIYYIKFLEPIYRIDKSFSNIMPYIRSNSDTEIFKYISFLADWPSLLVLSLVFLILLYFKRNFLGIKLLAIGLILDGAITYILKFLIARPRPIIAIVNETDFSFPSGHVLGGTLIIGFIIYLIYKTIKSKLGKYLLLIMYFLLIILISFSRIYLGVHYLTDVLGGFLIGTSILFILIYIYQTYNVEKEFKSKIFLSSTLLILIIYLIYAYLCFNSFTPMKRYSNYSGVTKLNFNTLSQDNINIVIDNKNTTSISGNINEPINVILIARSENEVLESLKNSTWTYLDNPNIYNTLNSYINSKYKTAPIAFEFISNNPQTYSFKNIFENKITYFRLWKTKYILQGGNEIYIGTYTSIDNTNYFPSLNLDIDSSRKELVDSLNMYPTNYLKLINNYQGNYITDDKIAVIDLTSMQNILSTHVIAFKL